MKMLEIDFTKKVGTIKPIHGICNAPILGTDNKLFHYLGEAGIPFSRLHDTGGRFGGACFVDIPNVFRNFDADADDPSSYDFAFTDWLLEELHKQKIEPFYRLGVTIENSHYIKPYHIYPPKDYKKWAQICAGIIRHYVEGWGNGFHYDIRYWEIWNEPDGAPDIKDNAMWKGTKEDYYKLYEVTANHLKKEFPGIKVGGYASCGFYSITKTFEKELSNHRIDYFLDFFHGFMRYISSGEHTSPLDFFSWHSYANVADTKTHAEYVRKELDRYGFADAESILDEWNPGTCNRGTQKDAALVASMMCAIQKSPVDVCTYYDGQVNTLYGGLFDPVHLETYKAYYSFVAFNHLYTLKNEVQSQVDTDDLFVCAATDAESSAILIVNPGSEEIDLNYSFIGLPTEGPVQWDCYVIDENHDFTKKDMECKLELKSPVGGSVTIGADSVVLIKLIPQR
jgi:xylan 1,4-beta-xylosidase